MTIARLAYAAVFFVSGLGVGVLWSPLGGSSRMPPDRRAVSDVQSENEKYVAHMREMYGEETADFVRQFEEMTIRIEEYPIDACASPDGRFVIRLFGSDETIASELRYPAGPGGVTELNRHYSFSHGDLAYRCDFGRSIEDSKMTNVIFGVTDRKGDVKFSYVDNDADGLWDKFADHTQEPSKIYVRDGLCWKERREEAPKEPDPAGDTPRR